ncbi:DUF6476 family protein [Falsirhodobacter sp. 20TX0035]|uniref:DUF6476 family protein n=1 Tax=Falsirhodobacter sp. 20TX0035 TaxID=3022019 RepID=UPI00232C397C|nr:DUF6476 family protein [Falsirhodobacter sp. 20TX0035]MDB6452047.1 DUF6476 family protein [Falsirhodobacter sp. 20TX0035]
MDEAPQGLPPGLGFLKALVTILTVVLIGGLITVIWLLVTRVPQALDRAPTLPPAIRLDGAVPTAVTLGRGWTAVVTEDNRILIFNDDGSLRQEVRVE